MVSLPIQEAIFFFLSYHYFVNISFIAIYHTVFVYVKSDFKGALNKYITSSPTFSKKVGFFVPLEVSAWVMTAYCVLHSRLT